MTLDLDGAVLHVNEVAQRLFGAATSNALVGRRLAGLVTPEEAPAAEAFVARVVGGAPGTLEFELAQSRRGCRWLAMHAAVVRDDHHPEGALLAIVHDVSERRRTEGMLRWEREALELILGPEPLEAVLDRLMLGLEALAPGILCSVLLTDPTDARRLRHASAPSLPAAYSAAIDGLVVGPQVGSCGTAVHFGRQVIVSDIEVDPLWDDFRELARTHGLRACWSTPIRAEGGGVVGTFAVYYRDVRHPDGAELDLIDRAERIVAVACMRKGHERALRESRERLDLALDGGRLGVWEWFPRTGRTTHNATWARLLDYEPSEVVHDIQFFKAHVHPDDLPLVFERLTAHLEGRTPEYESQHRMRTRTGTWKWVIDRGRVVRRDEQGPLLVSGVVTDVTALKDTGEALRASQSMVEAILDAIPVRVFWKDRDLRYLGCNAAFARDAGFNDPRDLIGKDDFAMGWRDVAELYRDDDRAVIASGRAKLHIEEPQTTPAGDTITLLTSKVPLRNAEGEITGVLGTYLDISERTRAEEQVRRLNTELEEAVRTRTAELRDSEAQLRDIFDGTGELIQSVGLDGRILFTNRAWRETLGYTEADTATMNIFDVIRGDHRDACAAFFEQLTSGDSAGLIETVFVAKDGSSRFVEGSVSMGRDAGRPVATRSILRDVTARRAIDRALRESEASYRLMIESSRDAILTLHPPDWRFTSCNPAAVELFGADHETQLCVSGPWAVSPAQQPDGRRSSDKAIEAIKSALASGACSFEWTHQRLDGTPFDATVQLSRVVQGGTTYLLATVRDITAQKRAEAALKSLNQDLDQLVAERTGQLRESEVRFRLLVDSSPNAILMTGVDGRISFANRRTESVLGYRPEELVGQSVETLLPHAARQRHVGHRAQAWQHNEPRPMGRSGSFMARRKDGSEVAIEVGLTPIDIGGARYMMATVTDVTARKVAEDAVKRLAAFPEVNPNPVMELDGTGALTYANAAAAALATGLGLDAPAAMLPDSAASIVKACLASGRERRGLEQRFGKRVLAWSFYPIADRGVVHAYAADITERVALETQLRQAQKMEAIGQLAGGVAHDFNNILSVVLMQAELSSGAEALSPEVREGLQEIQSCAERGADLTRQLLLFSRRQVMQPRDLDLNEVVTTTAKMLQRMIGEDIRLELHLHGTRMPVRADGGMLNQVLLNLAVNARDAMPKGGRLRVETTERALAEGDDRPYPDVLAGRYAVLRVSDTGSGIPADVLPRIFEPFFTTKEAGKGTGLGLATVFGIVRQHGGFLNVTSEQGQGTTFEICLPQATPAAAADAPKIARVPSGGSETILVVEDEPAVRHLLRSILRRRGYTVIEAGSGVEALKVWQEQRGSISLLFTDMVMPDGISGQELARRLRADNPELRVVFSSGYSPEIAGRELKLEPGENFLQKPFTTETLLEMVRRALDAPRAEAVA